jgi:hypothetical protein
LNIMNPKEATITLQGTNMDNLCLLSTHAQSTASQHVQEHTRLLYQRTACRVQAKDAWPGSMSRINE